MARLNKVTTKLLTENLDKVEWHRTFRKDFINENESFGFHMTKVKKHLLNRYVLFFNNHEKFALLCKANEGTSSKELILTGLTSSKYSVLKTIKVDRHFGNVNKVIEDICLNFRKFDAVVYVEGDQYTILVSCEEK